VTFFNRKTKKMATIKMGAIITEIAGSVGGTTFRRFKNGTVMQNKQFGASANKLLKNKSLPILSEVIKNWSSLTLAVRNEWISQALNFQFLDKFGVLKNLSGRQLYIKLQSQSTFSDQGIINPFTLLSTTPNFTVLNWAIDSTPQAQIILSIPLLNGTLSVQAEQIRNSSVGFNFTRREILKSWTVVTQSIFSYTAEFYAKFPNAKEGDYFNIYLFSSNNSGFRSTVIAHQVQITP